MAVFDPDKVRRLQLYRAAQSSPPSPRGTPKKKPSQAEPKGSYRYLRRSEPVFNMRKAVGQKNVRRRGRGGGETGQVKGSPGSVGGESENACLKGIESPASTPIRYWPLVPLGQGIGDISQTDLVAVKSSPSSMHLSSGISQRLSISSQESLARALSSSASEAARRKVFLEGRTSNNARSTDALEILSDLPRSGEIVEVHAHEPHLEITSFHSDDAVMDTTIKCSTSFLDKNNQQEPNPVVVKRRSRMSAKVADKVVSPIVSSDNNNQDGAVAEKGRGLQASHPIIEKLRKSWGLGLQAKHRHNAVAAHSDAGSDTSAENSGEFKVDSYVTARKKWDQAQVQSEVTEQAEQAEVATTDQPPDEREALIRNIITRERRAAITKQQLQLLQQQPPQPLKLIMDAEVLSKSNNSTTPSAAKAGLAKIQANCQRSKPELPSKFKKQYLHADPSMSKSLAMQRGNKENVQLEVKVPSPPTGFAWKRKPPVPTRRQLSPRNLGTAVNGVRGVPPQAAARATTAAHAHAVPSPAASTTQTTPAENLVVTSSSDNSGLLCTSTTKLGGPVDAADASGPKGETVLRKANDVAVLEGTVSTSSVLKLTKQRSDYKISSTSVKEAITSPVGAKAYENGTVRAADESDFTAAKDRRSHAVLQYEPRLHSVRAIKKWESTSGKRYYDLSPTERQKVNQEISAAAPRPTPAPKRRVHSPTSNSVRLRLT